MSLEYIASLDRKDTEAEGKYDNYVMKSMKRTPLQIDFKLPKHNNQDRMTTRDDIARLERKDTAIEAEMERVTNLAIPDMPSKFKPIVNEVTPEMIADYQEEQRKPIEINGKFYPYHPVDIELLTQGIPNIPTGPSPNRLKAIQDKQKSLLINLKGVQGIIKKIDQSIEESKLIFDKQQSEINEEVKAGYKTTLEGRQALKQNREGYDAYIKNMERAREKYSIEEQNISDELDSLVNIQQRDEEEYTQNRAEIARIENENKQLLDEAETTFNILNQGRAIVQRLPNESQEEYARRLEQTAQPPEIDAETLAERVVIRETEKLIANLKTILRAEQASNIAKMLTPEQKHAINKFFPKIKKAYEKTYSKTVKVSERELIDFFLQQTGYEEKPLSGSSQFIPVAQEFEPPPEENPFEEPPLAEAVYVPPIRAVRARQPRQSREQKGAEETRRPVGRPRKPAPEPVEIGGIRSFFSPREPETGEGIKSKSLPKRAHFGKVSINPHNLYHKNLLQVRNLKGQAIGVSDIKVSDGMSEMLLKMLEGVNPTKKDFAILEKHEPSLYNNLIHLAQLHKNYDTPNLNETKEQMKHRMELVQGEIEAGNTAPSILSEAKQLLRLMVGNGMLKSTQARKHYEYLKNYN